MAVSNLDFGATIDAWANESADRMERIFKASTQKLGSIANNGVPIDTGFARASFRASTDSMPMIDPNATNKHGLSMSFDIGEISVVIASASLGQTIFMGWSAAYILPLEFGHSKQAPQGFARLAAAQWPAIVSEVTAEAKVRSAAQ
jgi:hypothetical protein